MIRGKNQVAIKIFLAFVLCFSIIGGWVKPVRAETLTWTGNMSSAWNSIGNWSPTKIPTNSDVVIIPSTTTNDPVIPASYAALASSITIQTGGILTLSNNGSISAGGLIIAAGGELVTADESETTINLTGTLENHGTISSRGQLVINAAASTNDGTIICSGNYSSFTPIIAFNAPFNNAGTVDIQNGHVDLTYGGTHTGTFTGSTSNTGSYAGLWLGSETVSGQTFTFLSGSAITLPRLITDSDAVVNIFGTYAPSGASELRIWGTSTVTFDLAADSNVNVMADDVVVASTLYLNGSDGFTFSELSTGQNAYLIFNDSTSITGNFYWNGGTITGNGTTTVEASAEPVYIDDGTTHTLNGHTLTNKAEADWANGNIVLTNNAIIINDGIFNALGTYSMTGTVDESFINNGSFKKDNLGTTTTTTTMDIPFTNNGTVSIVAGNLNFLQGIDNGENAVINLGDGTLNPGDTLNLASGDSLIGSGTLAANLVSNGTVSPGNSAGNITVQGDYTQSADGILEIQLGGTEAGAPEFDQLIVTGFATLTGTLNVNLINDFQPQLGDSFLILENQLSGTGNFSVEITPPLPNGLALEVDYSDEGVTLTVVDSGGSGGTITGSVTCDSTNTVFVDLWANDYTAPPPCDTVQIDCNEGYGFTNLPDGTYFVGAWIDLNESGDGPPEPGEPTAWYGDPTAVTITGGETKSGVDITFPAESIKLFLPLILR